jgi:hypothetical protein
LAGKDSFLFGAPGAFHADAESEREIGIVRDGSVKCSVRAPLAALMRCGRNGKNFGMFDDLCAGFLCGSG